MKKRYGKIIAFAALIIIIVAISFAFGRFITFDSFKQNSLLLNEFVHRHYFLSLAVVASVYLSMAFFLPGAVLLTIGCGFLFGPGFGALYASGFLTIGSVLAFLASRHLFGRSVQQRFKHQLERFNNEIHRYGRNYLFVLHIQPVLPSFVINYLSGLTEMPLRRFAGVTFISLLPGSLVYAFAGRQLASMESARDILSANIVIGLGMLAVLALLPVVIARLRSHAAPDLSRSTAAIE